jgi:hypothetical protein
MICGIDLSVEVGDNFLCLHSEERTRECCFVLLVMLMVIESNGYLHKEVEFKAFRLATRRVRYRLVYDSRSFSLSLIPPIRGHKFSFKSIIENSHLHPEPGRVK